MSKPFKQSANSLWAIALLFACSCAPAPAACPCAPPLPAGAPNSSAAEIPPASRSTVELLKRALPGVVLLLNQRSDGKLGFGAGVLIDDHGLVLTNLHVVANATTLGAMFHDASRTSYTPMDGGLGRYFFENQKDVIVATLVHGDPVLDLAAVRIDIDTSKYPRLPFREKPIEVGESILALGHPQETVWSFTSGMVSSVHLGVIQHDAAINPGNSGGPLIDMEGKIVGINTAKLLSSSGVGFARPIAMSTLLISEVTAPFYEPDLSSPDKAILSCAHAAEISSPSYYNCLDWDAIYLTHEKALPETLKALELPKETADKFLAVWKKLGREYWIGLLKKGAKSELEGRDLKAIGEEAGKRARISGGAWGIPSSQAGEKKAELYADLQKLLSDFQVYQAEWDQELMKRNGLKADRRNPRARIEIRKMGIRAEKVVFPSPDRAWVHATGRNLDGTLYRYSAYFVKYAKEWKERHPFEEDEATLPKDFPPPLSSPQKDLAKARAYLTALITSGEFEAGASK